MEINISGHQIDLGQSVQSYVRSRFESLLEKFAARILDIRVIFEKAPHDMFVSEIVIHELGHKCAFSKIENKDIYKAFDACFHKIEQQLNKHKSKAIDI